MSAFVERFNAIAYPQTRRLQDLEPGKHYNVEGMKKVNTRFGLACVVELKDETEVFDVFLPARYGAISDEEIQSTDYSKLHLLFDGSVKLILK